MACYQSDLRPIDKRWALAVVTSIIVNTFKVMLNSFSQKGFLFICVGGLFQDGKYIAKILIGQKGLNKCPKMQQCRDCPFSFLATEIKNIKPVQRKQLLCSIK